jgi:hypothetical protein
LSFVFFFLDPFGSVLSSSSLNPQGGGVDYLSGLLGSLGTSKHRTDQKDPLQDYDFDTSSDILPSLDSLLDNDLQ